MKWNKYNLTFLEFMKMFIRYKFALQYYSTITKIFFFRNNKKNQAAESSDSTDEPPEKKRRIEETVQVLIQENANVEKENVPVAVVNRIIQSTQLPMTLPIIRPQPQVN